MSDQCFGARQIRWLWSSLLVVLISLISAGCVTETTGGINEGKRDTERLVETSVSAAVKYMREGDADDAYRHLNRALKADKKNASVHNALALLYRMTGDVELEERHFKLAIRHDPKSAQARNNYATFLFREGRYKGALKQVKRAVKDPGYKQRELALLNMGRIYLKLEQPDEAIKAFERAVRLNDELASAHYELAFLHEAEGRLPQANKHLVSFGKYARHTPQSLWLGIRMQRVLGNQDALASYRLALKNLFPGSEEYRLYTESKSDFQTKSDAEAVEMPISAMDEGARGESKAVPPPEVPSVGVKAPPKGAKSEEGVDSLDDEDEY